MLRGLVNNTVPAYFSDEYSAYLRMHRELQPLAISVRAALGAPENLKGKTIDGFVKGVDGLDADSLSKAKSGEKVLTSEQLAALRALLPHCKWLSEDTFLRPKLIDYYMSTFARDAGFCKDNQVKWPHLSGLRLAQHRGASEVQAFLLEGFAKETRGIPFHQHEGQEVLACLEGSLEVFFWPLDEPVRLAKNEMIYFDGGHPHKMVSTVVGTSAISIIGARDRMAVEVSVQSFYDVRDRDARLLSTRMKSVPRDALSFRLRPADVKGNCTPEQQAWATIDIMRSPRWRETVKAVTNMERPTLEGRAAMDQQQLKRLARILGHEDMSRWNRPLRKEAIVRRASFGTTDQLPDLHHARVSHAAWYHSSNATGPLLVQHAVFSEEQLQDANVHLYPSLLRVNRKVTEPGEPQTHARDQDQGIEFWYVLQGQLGLRWADDDGRVRGEGSGELDPGDAVMYDSRLKHVPFVPPDAKQDTDTLCLHVYFARGSGKESFNNPLSVNTRSEAASGLLERRTLGSA